MLGPFPHLINACVLAAKGTQLPQLMSLAQYMHPSRSPLPIILHLQYHEDIVKHCSCFTPEMCSCLQIHEVATGKKVSSLHPLCPYCWGSQEEDLALRLQHLLVDTQYSLQKHTDHRRLKHSLSLKDLTQFSTAQQLGSAAAKSHTWVSVPPPLYLCIRTAMQFAQTQLSPGDPVQLHIRTGKGTRERSFCFLDPPSMNSISTDVDHSSSCLLYRSFNMHMLYHPIHAFLQWDPYMTMISVEIMRVQKIAQTTTTVKRWRETLWSRMRKRTEEIQSR